MRARRGWGCRAAETWAALRGRALAGLSELLILLGTGVSVQPEGTGFPAIPGPGAGASLVAVGPWVAPGPRGRLMRDVVWKPISVFMVEFPGLCLECSVVTAAWRTPHLFSENTWIKEANLKLAIYVTENDRRKNLQ